MSGLIKGIFSLLHHSRIDSLTCMRKKRMIKAQAFPFVIFEFYANFSRGACSVQETNNRVLDLFILPMIRKAYHFGR